MNRRRFLKRGILTTGIIGGAGSGYIRRGRESVAVSFSLDTVPEADPSEVDQLNISLSTLDIRPQYIVENESADLTVSLKLSDSEGKNLGSDSVDTTVPFTNGETVSMNQDFQIRSLYLNDIKPSSDASYIDGQISVQISHLNIDKEYVKRFTVNPPGLISKNLVSRWTMDGGSGSTIKDAVGSYDGSRSNPNWQSDSKQGSYCLDFNRSQQDIVLLNGGNDLSDYNFRETGVTITQWVYPYKTGNNRHGLFSANDSNNWWNTRIESNGKYEVWYGSNGENPNTQTNSSPPTNQWSHFTATVDPNNYTVKAYYNGSFENSRNNGDTPNYKQFSEPTIGSRDNDNYADARIDDVRLYDRVLDESEIQDIANLNG